MKLALSNLALPAVDHRALLPRLPALGVKGLEVSVRQTWGCAPDEVTGAMVEDYRRVVAAEGLDIPALFLAPEDMATLGPVEDDDLMEETGERLLKMAAVCRDLGAPSLVVGAPRRGRGPDRAAWAKCRDFLGDLLGDLEGLGTTLCFAPMGPKESDFCATARDCYLMSNALDEDGFGMHLASAGLTASGETGHTIFAMVLGRLEHYHADDPGLAEVGSTGLIDHVDLGHHLAAIDYERWVSVVQRAPDGENDPLASVARGVAFVQRHYIDVEGHERL
jgi:sugar phosphate isomerase/epimerase